MPAGQLGEQLPARDDPSGLARESPQDGIRGRGQAHRGAVERNVCSAQHELSAADVDPDPVPTRGQLDNDLPGERPQPGPGRLDHGNPQLSKGFRGHRTHTRCDDMTTERVQDLQLATRSRSNVHQDLDRGGGGEDHGIEFPFGHEVDEPEQRRLVCRREDAVDRHHGDLRALAFQRGSHGRRRGAVLLQNDPYAGQVAPAQVGEDVIQALAPGDPGLTQPRGPHRPDGLGAAGEDLAAPK